MGWNILFYANTKRLKILLTCHPALYLSQYMNIYKFNRKVSPYTSAGMLLKDGTRYSRNSYWVSDFEKKEYFLSDYTLIAAYKYLFILNDITVLCKLEQTLLFKPFVYYLSSFIAAGRNLSHGWKLAIDGIWDSLAFWVSYCNWFTYNQ